MKKAKCQFFVWTIIYSSILPLVFFSKGLAKDDGLARTPPMGWNSWNAFQEDINESKIRAIADALVSSGMRDAGYAYLVLDDRWMAKERDGNGSWAWGAKEFVHLWRTSYDISRNIGVAGD